MKYHYHYCIEVLIHKGKVLVFEIDSPFQTWAIHLVIEWLAVRNMQYKQLYCNSAIVTQNMIDNRP